MLAFVIFFIIEFIIAVFIHDDLIRPFVGDVLVIILLYCAIKSIFAKASKYLPLYILIFSFAVEIGQYFNLVQLLNLENNGLVAIIIGTVFDVKDLICYFVGFVFLIIWQAFEYRHINKSN